MLSIFQRISANKLYAVKSKESSHIYIYIQIHTPEYHSLLWFHIFTANVEYVQCAFQSILIKIEMNNEEYNVWVIYVQPLPDSVIMSSLRNAETFVEERVNAQNCTVHIYYTYTLHTQTHTHTHNQMENAFELFIMHTKSMYFLHISLHIK